MVSESDTPSNKAKNGNAQRKTPQSKPRKIKKHPEGDSLLDIHVPRRVSGGKISPVMLLLVFGGMLLGMIYMASKMSSMFVPKKGNYRRMTTSPVNRQVQRTEAIRRSFMDPLIEMILHEDPNAFTAIEKCGVYLGHSSIPDSGLGLFAGKNHTVGEWVRVEKTLPSIISGSKSATPWSLVLKPHSLLSNVKWEQDVLVATRDITQGEELFVSWEDHPVSGDSPLVDIFADSLPKKEHYLRADELIRDARVSYFGAINYTELEKDEAKQNQRKGSHYSNARWNRVFDKKRAGTSRTKLYKKESVSDIEKGLRLFQSTVKSYEPMVAKLLPTKAWALAMYHKRAVEDKSLFSSSSLLGSLKNQTVRSLSNSATCVSFLEWQPISDPGDESNSEESCSSSSRYNQIVTRERGFVKGDIVGVVPLLAIQQTVEDCVPLPSLSTTEKVSLCLLGGIEEYTRNATLANVEYRWKSSTMKDIPSGVKSLLTQSVLSPSLSTEEEKRQKEILLKELPLSLSWDIVALRDIKHNEKVVAYYSGNIPPIDTEVI